MLKVKKINRSNRNKKSIVIPLVLLLLLALGLLAYAYYLSSKSSDEDARRDQGQSQQAQDADQDAIKDNAIDRGEESAKNNTNTPTPTSTPSDQLIRITKTYTDSTSLVVQTSLSNSVSWRSCTLRITDNEGRLIETQTAEIIYQEPNSTCAGFSIQKSNLPSGTYNLLLTGVANDGASHETKTQYTT
jgi:type III secretory pathway component EscV